jgi:Trypsin-co-occurring domain 1
VPELVPITFETGLTVYVEASAPATLQGGTAIREAAAEDAAVRALDTGQQLVTSIRAFCERVIDSLHELHESALPAKATVEFGLDISVEGNVYVVKGTGAATIKITAEWEFVRVQTR